MSDMLSDLRQTFDAMFGMPPGEKSDTNEDFLAVTVGDTRCALRLRDVVHLSARPDIVPMQGRRPELLGLVGLRGTILPVYSLAALSGRAPLPAMPRWLVSGGAGPDVAFAFDDFERLLRVPPADISRVAASSGDRRHPVDEIVRDGAVVRPVIDLGSLVRMLTGRTFPPGGHAS